MKISNDIRLAIELCLRHGIAFVAYANPSERRLKFQSSLGETDCDDCDYFFVNTFASPLESLVKIPFLADEQMTIAALDQRPTDICRTPSPSLPSPTCHRQYIESVDNVIAHLKEKGGKTVISRTICGSIPGIDWIEFARQYFSELPLTYRFIYYTPATGAWIVATPELLFSHNRSSATSHTVALAGTRVCSADDKPWDDKNLKEQKIVSDYISECLESNGLNFSKTGPHSSKFGNIEHLCTSFDIFDTVLSAEKCFRITDSLSPTPAVSGYPVDVALKEIREAEKHHRGCYSGYLGFATSNNFMSVVNLRCLQFSGYDYCIYAGGGIMPDSDSSREWLETESKTEKARLVLERFSNR